MPAALAPASTMPLDVPPPRKSRFGINSPRQ
jgi:hypothetical protein